MKKSILTVDVSVKELDKFKQIVELNIELQNALREFVSNSSVQTNFPNECETAEAALAKADGGAL